MTVLVESSINGGFNGKIIYKWGDVQSLRLRTGGYSKLSLNHLLYQQYPSILVLYWLFQITPTAPPDGGTHVVPFGNQLHGELGNPPKQGLVTVPFSEYWTSPKIVAIKKTIYHSWLGDVTHGDI